MRVTDAFGRFGEQLAAQHLEAAGLTVLARNWRCRDGEIDLVAREGETLVFCEVKTRRGSRYGNPAEAVSRVKTARIRQLAAAFLAAERPPYSEIRFDVVAVLALPGKPVALEHLRGAF